MIPEVKISEELHSTCDSKERMASKRSITTKAPQVDDLYEQRPERHF